MEKATDIFPNFRKKGFPHKRQIFSLSLTAWERRKKRDSGILNFNNLFPADLYLKIISSHVINE